MTHARYAAIAALLVLSLGGCAGGGGRDVPSPPPPPISGLSDVPPQQLNPGQCGLALWTLAPSGRRLFWADAAPPVARIVLDGHERTLPRTEEEGEAAFGFAPRSTYAGDGVLLTVDIELETRGNLLGGAVVRAGSIALTAADGTETVLPVTGLVACR